MPLRYANEPDVLGQLGVTNPGTEYDRLVRLENGLCDTFDHKAGRSFGVAPVAETRDVSAWASGTYPNAFTSRLILETPIRTVTRIEIDGIWNGIAWTGGSVLAAGDYWLTHHTDEGSYAIDLDSGHWYGTARVTGVWADQPTAGVPDDVREALTFITLDEYRARNASPAGEIGPDGLMVRVRNPWRFELVRTAIERHQITRILV